VVQNKFQEGDLVLYDAGPKPHPKMASRHKGPYEVVRQNKNDVQVRDIVTGVVLEFSVVDLEPFFGDKSEAVIAARHDQEQHEVVEILSYRGDHNERSNLQFMVKYAVCIPDIYKVIRRNMENESSSIIPAHNRCER
jgi:hypothetical protein